MRETALDALVHSAETNRTTIPMFRYLIDTIKETKPKPYMWFDWDPANQMHRLPDTGIEWPAGAFCLTPGTPILGSTYSPALFRIEPPKANLVVWMRDTPWTLEGVMVFSPGPDTFDVIPIMKKTCAMPIRFPEVQLHFKRTDTGWKSEYAGTGPVNHYFYDFFRAGMTPEQHASAETDISFLGATINMFLGSWLKYTSQPGKWRELAAKPPRMKRKGDTVKKIYRLPLLGYSEFVPSKG